MSTPRSAAGNGLEARIIDVARQMFMEEGFAGTRMCHIAERVGINRPTLHYYFRTKEKMFMAVFGDIVKSVIPKIQEIIVRTDLPIADRVGMIVDCYYDIFRRNPFLPLFIIREMQRDIGLLVSTCGQLDLLPYMNKVIESMQGEMDSGHIRRVPIRFVFYTFYSMLSMPFVTYNLGNTMLLEDGETFDEMLDKWKPYIVSQITAMLTP